MNFAEFRDAVARAEDHWRDGDALQAKRAYRELVALRGTELEARHAGRTAADLEVIERLADLAVPFGEVEAADDLLAALDGEYRRLGLAWRADQVAIKRLHLAMGAGRLGDAAERLRGLEGSLGPIEDLDTSKAGLAGLEARSPWPRDARPALFAQLYLELGRLLAALGQHRNALGLLARGLLHSDADGALPRAREASIPLRLSVAATLLQQGELSAATAALAALPAPPAGPAGLWGSRQRELRARLHLLRGEWTDAVAELERVIEACRTRGLTRAEAWAAANLAGVRLLLNDVAGARALLAGAGKVAAACRDAALVSWVERRLALVGERAGLLLDADPALTVAGMQEAAAPISPIVEGAAAEQAASGGAEPPWKPAVRPGDGLTWFEMRAMELQVLLAHRELGRAEACLDDLRSDFGDWDSHLIQLRLEVLGSTVEYYRGLAAAQAAGSGDDYYRRAEAGFLQARSELERLGLRPELYEVQRRLGWCWRGLDRPPSQLDAVLEESQLLLDGMARSLPAQQRAAYLANKWSADEQSLAVDIAAMVRVRSAALAAKGFRRLLGRFETWRRLEALIDRIYRLKTELLHGAVQSPRHGAAAEGHAARLSSLAWKLIRSPRRRATLAFVVLPNQTLVVRIGWMSLDFDVRPVTRLEVRGMVREWHRQVTGLAGPASLDGAAAGRVAAALSDRLGIAAQLGRLPPGVRELIVVPDDALHGFPFAALPLAGGYVVERFAISTAFQLDPQLAAAARHNGRGERREAVVAGVDECVGELPALPDGERQLRRVGRWLAGRGIAVSTLRNGDATRAELLARLPRATWWHMSCHGIFSPDRPEATGLVLLPAAPQESHALLSLRDLAGLRLDGLQQVVLASCWAADNYLLPGRWVVSLPDVLCRAGAVSVLACLWEVEDQAVGRLCRGFYAGLDRLPRSQALRRAQLRMLRRRETAHPLYWAGYQVYGDAGRLRLRGAPRSGHGGTERRRPDSRVHQQQTVGVP